MHTPSLYPVNVISIVIFSITFILGVPGNAVVIWIAGLKMKRTVNTVWFLNLAIADLLCCLSLPFFITITALDYHWPLGHSLCKLITSGIVINLFASVFMLSAISVDRCLLMTKPIWSQNNRTTRLASALCTVIWGLAFIMSLPCFIYYEARSNDDEYIECNYNFGDHASVETMKITINVTRAIFGFIIPFLVMIVCYIMITRKLRASHFNKSKKTFKLIVSIIIVFLVCWLPYHVTGILGASLDPESSKSDIFFVIDILSINLACANSCINPILYVLMGQNFRGKFKWSIRTAVERGFKEEYILSSCHRKSMKKSSLGDTCSEL
ncbi:C3a anaphylatoxin chemotactic receptor-like [Latimeria chalumnae]|uniref:C3a anaphylatoxin chemotactic receptor-like n=1 Tax=Latimeria chalumnae TaxID=7897 RepID=UPI0006D93B68|nr:PREDICTED: C3a anaphylatoxin chemotactic receptor-like [Latimeria chalumnae]|eukprot:XP_014349195.1 PREDICTED: C3a anaphylatoxin chemotactic receptor-like [Latimeria chalumnae]